MRRSGAGSQALEVVFVEDRFHHRVRRAVVPTRVVVVIEPDRSDGAFADVGAAPAATAGQKFAARRESPRASSATVAAPDLNDGFSLKLAPLCHRTLCSESRCNEKPQTIPPNYSGPMPAALTTCSATMRSSAICLANSSGVSLPDQAAVLQLFLRKFRIGDDDRDFLGDAVDDRLRRAVRRNRPYQPRDGGP